LPSEATAVWSSRTARSRRPNELFDELRIVDHRRRERLRLALGAEVGALDRLEAERDLGDLALGEVRLELGVLQHFALPERRHHEVDDEQQAEQRRREPNRREPHGGPWTARRTIRGFRGWHQSMGRTRAISGWFLS
jgi:hypothetical protein